MIFKRTKLLIGQDNLNRLAKSHVCIFGLGGVGGFAAEALARAGIGNFTLVDFDTVDITNINRQIIATLDSVGKDKVDVMSQRLYSINKDLIITKYKEMLTAENINLFFENKNYDYVVDAIDKVTSKIALIDHCTQNNIKIISSMGTGKKLDPTKLKISDLSKTSVCPLAKVIRRELKKRNIKKLNVVFSTEPPKKNFESYEEGDEKIIGSISFVPPVSGLMLASKVVRDIIQLD